MPLGTEERVVVESNSGTIYLQAGDAQPQGPAISTAGIDMGRHECTAAQFNAHRILGQSEGQAPVAEFHWLDASAIGLQMGVCLLDDAVTQLFGPLQ